MADLRPGQTKKRIYVNSRDRISGTSGNFKYKLNGFRLANVESFYVEKVLIPYSFYNISSDLQNNFITIQEQTGLSTFTIQIASGQYTKDYFYTFVSGVLTSASPNGLVYTVADNINPQRPTMRISATGNFKILWATGTNTYLWRIMGYDPIDSPTFEPTQIGQNTYNFNIAPNILVRSNTLTYNDSNIYKSNSSNVILSAPMASFQEILQYEPSSFALYPYSDGSKSLIEFDLFLTFDYDIDVIIDMQGVDFTMTLVVIVNNVGI